MKKIVKIIFCVMVCLVCHCTAHLIENKSDVNIPDHDQVMVSKLIWGGVLRQHHAVNVHKWAREVKLKYNFSDEFLKKGFLSYIHQKEINYLINTDNINSDTTVRDAIKATDVVMDLFPGDEQLESSIVLAWYAYSSEVRSDSLLVTYWSNIIVKKGSIECNNYLSDLLSRSARKSDTSINVRKEFSFSRGAYPEGIYFENYVRAVTGVSFGWIFFYVSLFLIIATKCYCKIKHKTSKVTTSIVIFVIVACCLMFLLWLSVREKRWSRPDTNRPLLAEVPRSELSHNLEKTAANKFPRQRLDEINENQDSNYVKSARSKHSGNFEILMQNINLHMTPFKIADPENHVENFSAREAAAGKLLELLKSGRPEDCKEENWQMIVQQIIAVQSCSPASMGNAINMIESWINNPASNEQETFAALTAMMQWQQSIPFKRDTPEFQRFGRIADMQVALFEKASPALRGKLLWNLGQAEKIISEPKSQMPQKLITDQHLLELVGSLRQDTAAGMSVDGQALMVISNRIKDQPDSFPIFESTLRQILAGNGADVMGRMSALEMLTAQAKKSGKLPEWSGDVEIVRQLATMQAGAVPRGADRQPTGKEPDFIDSQALGVIRNRVTADPVNSGRVYGEMLVAIARKPANDSYSRLSALDLAVKAGVLTAEEIRSQYGKDPVLGVEIQKRFAR